LLLVKGDKHGSSLRFLQKKKKELS
jgi:hypothetical protein